MAKTQPNRLTVRRDHTLDTDLATVMRTGMTQTDAVKYALHLIAQGLDWMWDSGAVPDGTLPPVVKFRVPPPPRPDQRV